MSEIVNLTFKTGTGSCGGCSGWTGWDQSGFDGGCGGCSKRSSLSGVFPTIFILYLIDLPSEAL